LPVIRRFEQRVRNQPRLCQPVREKTPTGLLALAFKRTPLFNGALECRLFEYKKVVGGMRKKKA